MQRKPWLLLIVPLLALFVFAAGCDSVECCLDDCRPTTAATSDCCDCMDCVCNPCDCVGGGGGCCLPPNIMPDILTEAEHFAPPNSVYHLNETKLGGPCLTCPPQYRPPTVIYPTAPAPRPSNPAPIARPTIEPKPSPLNEAKTGTWLCRGCNETKVGPLFRTSWTDEGRPVTFLCAECWERKTPAEVLEVFEDWHRRQSIPLDAANRMRSAVISEL